MDSWNTQPENKFMSVNNINVIISGTIATVRVRFVDPWATNIKYFPLVKLDTSSQLVRLKDLA